LTLKFDSLVSRIAVAVAAGVVCVLLVRVGLEHFVIRVVADQRYGFNRESMVSAIEKQPDSARVNLRLAESEMTFEPEQALRHAARAVELSPWDYRARRTLALAQELNGQPEEAERSMKAAVKLAPNHGELNWALANLLVRAGKFKEAVPHFRIAATRRGAEAGESFELLWVASGGSLDMLNAVTENNPGLQLSLVQFLIAQGRVQDAIAIFGGINRETRLRSPQSGNFLQGLIQARQFEVARQLWLDLACAQARIPPASTGPIWNPGFETDPLKNFGQFDWNLNANQYARIGFDRSQAHGGARSLRIQFTGVDTTTLKDQVIQPFVPRPGARYRLQCFVKHTNLVTPEGPRLAVIGPDRGVLAASEPLEAGTADWRVWALDFTAPAGEAFASISIIRIPRFSYDEPTRGTVWVDDFSLTEIGRN
jgi:hypothetical protein